MCQRRSLARWGRLCCVRPVEAVHILCAGCVSLGRFSQWVGTCTEGVVSHVWCHRARIGVALTRHARPPSEQPHTDDDGVGAGKEQKPCLLFLCMLKVRGGLIQSVDIAKGSKPRFSPRALGPAFRACLSPLVLVAMTEDSMRNDGDEEFEEDEPVMDTSHREAIIVDGLPVRPTFAAPLHCLRERLRHAFGMGARARSFARCVASAGR